MMAPDTSTERGPDAREEDYRAYDADVSDDCGCAELWEYLSERRSEG